VIPRRPTANLVGVAPVPELECGGAGTDRVVPGDPDGSLVVQKIEAAIDPLRFAACGDPMPRSGRPLSRARIDLVRAWIAAGALEGEVMP
jgi:hypothetical protein